VTIFWCWFSFISRFLGKSEVLVLSSFLRKFLKCTWKFAFEVICLKVLSSRVKKLLDCVCRTSLLLLFFSGGTSRSIQMLVTEQPFLLITSLCV